MNDSKFFVVLKNEFRSLKDGKQKKRLITFINNQPNHEKLEIITREEHFARGNQLVEVIDCVHGHKVTIPLYNLGTCCDPSLEIYHSM